MDYLDAASILDEPIEQTATEASPILELEDGEIDPRYLRLSYSGLGDLHACPRLFQLRKLQAESKVDMDSSVTFAYGHAVGTGIQDFLISKDMQKTIWNMFLAWPCDFFAENEKQKKSLAHAIAALQQFASMCDQGFLSEYEVMNYEGKPAAELSFRVKLPAGFSIRGFLDLVLSRFSDNERAVLEVKTNSGTWVNPYQYKNSSQGIGYSAILDKIEGGTSAYSVEYLVQMTKLERFEQFTFPKTMHQRAMWIRDILYDVEQIKSYVTNEGNYGIWPLRGESCTRFGRTCEFMDICQLPTQRLMQPAREIHRKDINRDGVEVEYQFDLTLQELLDSQSVSKKEVSDGSEGNEVLSILEEIR